MNKTHKLMGLSLITGMIFLTSNGLAMAVDLGSAGNFGVLAGSAITFGGATTTITGDIGSSPTPAITGLANLILDGANHYGDAITVQAKSDLATAYSAAAALTPSTYYGAAFDLGGLTLASGVYNGSSSLAITGDLTLDAKGNSDATWVFQANSTLNATSGSNIILVNGARAENIVWQVGSSATLNTDAFFTGTILALTSITLDTGATVLGRVLAQNGAVTFNGNTVMVPEVGTVQFLAIGLVVILTMRRRISDYL
jgi:Ice-binding-like